MSRIRWGRPVIINVPDPQGGRELLRGAHGKDDWQNPGEFVVRLDHAASTDDGYEYHEVARFVHDGHSVFTWDPPHRY